MNLNILNTDNTRLEAPDDIHIKAEYFRHKGRKYSDNAVVIKNMATGWETLQHYGTPVCRVGYRYATCSHDDYAVRRFAQSRLNLYIIEPLWRDYSATTARLIGNYMESKFLAVEYARIAAVYGGVRKWLEEGEAFDCVRHRVVRELPVGSMWRYEATDDRYMFFFVAGHEWQKSQGTIKRTKPGEDRWAVRSGKMYKVVEGYDNAELVLNAFLTANKMEEMEE